MYHVIDDVDVLYFYMDTMGCYTITALARDQYEVLWSRVQQY